MVTKQLLVLDHLPFSSFLRDLIININKKTGLKCNKIHFAIRFGSIAEHVVERERLKLEILFGSSLSLLEEARD